MNNKYSRVILVFRKNLPSLVLKICTTLIVGIFERICYFEEVFLMAIRSTELVWKKFSAMLCYWLYMFPSCRSSHWRCSVRKGVPRNFLKFTGKHLWHSLFFSKVAHFWSFLCLVLKISCLFYFNRKMKWQKGNTLMEFKYLLFCSSIDLLDKSKISKEIWQKFDQKMCLRSQSTLWTKIKIY